MKTITAFLLLELCMFLLLFPKAPKTNPITADAIMVGVDSIIKQNEAPLNSKARCLRNRIELQSIEADIINDAIEDAARPQGERNID
jgi:hypothetical protein